MLQPPSAPGSMRDQAEISSLQGQRARQGEQPLAFLLDAAVLSSPGSSEVRQISKSVVFGLPITTAVFPSSARRIDANASSCEERAKTSASV